MLTAFCMCNARSNLCFNRTRFSLSCSITRRSSDNNKALISSACQVVSLMPCTVLQYYALKPPRFARSEMSSSTPFDNSLVSIIAFFNWGPVNFPTAKVCSMNSAIFVARSRTSLLSASCDFKIYQSIKLLHCISLKSHTSNTPLMHIRDAFAAGCI